MTQKALNDLKDAASAMLTDAFQAFRAARPEEYAVLHSGFEAGRVHVGVTVRLLPELVVECWAEEPGSERQTLVTLSGQRVSRAVN